MKHQSNDEHTIASFKSDRRTNNKLLNKKISIQKDTIDITNYKSFTIDLHNPILVEGCHGLLTYISKVLDTKIIYVIEKKIKNNQAHVHGYFISEKTLKAIKKEFHYYLSGTHTDVKDMFSLEGWQSYITKENPTIHTVGQSF